MIGPLLWLMRLLTYSDTERAFLGSRHSIWCRRLGVNMGFSDEDRILMKNLCVLKVVKQEDLLRNFRKVGTAGSKQTYEKAARIHHNGYR